MREREREKESERKSERNTNARKKGGSIVFYFFLLNFELVNNLYFTLKHLNITITTTTLIIIIFQFR